MSACFSFVFGFFVLAGMLYVLFTTVRYRLWVLLHVPSEAERGHGTA